MANTVQPHFSQNVFLHQSHTTTKQQQNLGVWQDKRAEGSARIATGQPALAATGGRAQQLKKDTPRSQYSNTAFQKKEKVTFWVRPIAKTLLQRVAKSEKLTLSEAGAAIFERAIQQNIDMQYGALLQPIIEQAIRKEMRPIKYLTFLLVRVAFASEQTRSLATNILGRQPGMTADNLNEILDASSEAAKDKITHRTPQLEEIIAEGAKASIRYIAHRPGKEGAGITRKLFGIDGLMGREHAYRFIDEAEEGSLFYRFILSPDPELEDTRRDLHLRDMTEKTMQKLERRLKQEVQWVAAEHDDHAPNRHVHVVAVVKRKLHIPDFEAMRERATEAALLQRRERDFARAQRPRQWLTRDQTAPGFARELPLSRAKDVGRQYARVRPANTLQICFHCGHLQVKPFSKGVQTCRNCGWKLYQKHQPRLKSKEAQWGR